MNTVTYVTYRTRSRMTCVPQKWVILAEAWLIHMSHSYECIPTRHVSQMHVWRGRFICDTTCWCVTWRILMCDTTHSPVSSIWMHSYAAYMARALIVTWHIHMWHAMLRHSIFIRHNIFICDMPHRTSVVFFQHVMPHMKMPCLILMCDTRHATSHAGGVFPLRFVATKVARRCLYIYMYVYMHGIGMSHV